MQARARPKRVEERVTPLQSLILDSPLSWCSMMKMLTMMIAQQLDASQGRCLKPKPSLALQGQRKLRVIDGFL
jgi:hypothetical protein